MPIQQRQGQSNRAQSSTNMFVNEIRARIDTYFNIVLRNVRDTVPKTIGYFLVKMSQEKLQFEMYNRINNNSRIIECLGEPASVAERRKMLSSTIDTLKKSLKVLQRDPDITASSFDDGELMDELRKDAMQKNQQQNANRTQQR